MIKKYKIGNPIETDSVIVNIPDENGPVPAWSTDGNSLEYSMSPDAVIYGLGETVRGINKRGWKYVSFNSDDPNHTETKNSLYASHNFFIYSSADERFGMYIDSPGRITFDIGYSDIDSFRIVFDDPDAWVYTIEGDSLRDIVRQFRNIIGKSYIPPRWAFGYGQSRWGYKCADDIREVVRNYRDNGIPLDSVYLDIDYMDNYKDFTINEEAFPDFEGFVAEMKSEDIHLVPIIDAGVKAEEGYEVCDEGLREGYFCTKENGEVLTAAVWPGRSYFPDFLNERVREWFGGKYAFLLGKGIEGFWNDMNEPAIFYTEDHIKEVFDKTEEYSKMNLDINSYFEFMDMMYKISNNEEDYRRFYHNYKGRRIRHDKVHNLYGFNMTRAAAEAFERLCPDKKILMFSRASYIGMHRYSGVWCGDNQSWWSHLLMNLKQLPGLNMCGFLYAGADIGGFGSDTTEDLLLRWLELGIFIPLFRNHSALGTRSQEAYRFKRKDDFRNIISLRYALIPFIYGEFLKAVENDDMMYMPLSFVFSDDKRTYSIEDQLMIGDNVMIAPVYEQNATGRHIYLPEDMLMIRFRDFKDRDEVILDAGDHYIDIALNEVVVFIRKGFKLPLCTPARSVSDIDESTATYISF